jgi:transposase
VDRSRLAIHLAQGLSVAEIGEAESRHPSTVSYWLRKHHLVPAGRSKHAPKGALPKKELEALIADDATLSEMATAMDRSEATVRHWLRSYGLSGRQRRGPRPIVSFEKVQAAIREGCSTIDGECPTHGSATFVIENSGRARCRACRQARVAEWRRRVKQRLVAEAGGKCRLCGYSRHVGALEFHHLDPGQKEFGLSVRGLTRSYAALQAEAGKCVLLCANCHAEVEGGVASLPLDCDGAKESAGISAADLSPDPG